MKIIDRYIIKKILFTFLFVVTIVTTVVVMIDASEKMDDFEEHSVAWVHILDYYQNFAFWIVGLITPLMIFIAVLFITSRMAGHSEIIAIYSVGTNFRRLLYPYLVSSFIVAAFHFTLNAWIIPKANQAIEEFRVIHLKKNSYTVVHDIHIQMEPQLYLSIKEYDMHAKRGYNLAMERFNNNQLMERFTAQIVQWDSTIGKWHLEKWERKPIDTIFHLNYMPQTSIKRSGANMDTVLSITPKDFANKNRNQAGMTLNELSRHIETLKFRGLSGIEAFEVEWHLRFSSSFTIFILVCMGFILSSKKNRGGTGYQIALGMLLSFILIIMITISRTLAETGTLSPIMSAWISSGVFSLLTYGMYRQIHQ